jgi:hypothetical protein
MRFHGNRQTRPGRWGCASLTEAEWSPTVSSLAGPSAWAASQSDWRRKRYGCAGTDSDSPARELYSHSESEAHREGFD